MSLLFILFLLGIFSVLKLSMYWLIEYYGTFGTFGGFKILQLDIWLDYWFCLYENLFKDVSVFNYTFEVNAYFEYFDCRVFVVAKCHFFFKKEGNSDLMLELE